MQHFWEIVASNALLVIVLAVGVSLLGRAWKNPLYLHLLWVLVLLKLVTPPLVAVPIPLRAMQPWAASEAQAVNARDARRLPAAAFQPDAPSTTPRQSNKHLSDGWAIAESSGPDHVAPLAGQQGIPWLSVLGWMWGAGSVLCAVGYAYRILRFRRLFHSSEAPSTAVLNTAEAIAGRLGLRWFPEIRMLSVCVSPLVWSLGGTPRVFLPAALFERLDAAAQEAILAHELAHVRRKDHWVRLLEMMVTTLFWWHPVVWWAARRLQELEDQCCDAMVLDLAAQEAKTYATALLDTLDFLCERSIVAPLGATAANSFRSLTRRIAMLKDHSFAARLTVARLMLVLAVAALPMALAFGQKPETTETASQAVVQKRAINKLVKDFPHRLYYDSSTPELVMARVFIHSLARKDVRSLRELAGGDLSGLEVNGVKLDSESAKKLAGQTVLVSENPQALDNAEIVEVLTYNDHLAAVIHKCDLYPPNRQYGTQFFCRIKGAWTPLDSEVTENLSASVAAAEENSGKRKDHIWQAYVKTKDLMERGWDDLRAKKYNEAIAAFSEAIAVDPKAGAALYGRGLAYFFREDWDKAIADFTIWLRPTTDVNGVTMHDASSTVMCDADDVAMCRYLRGLAYASQKDGLDKARDDMMVALGLDSAGFAESRVGAYLICSIAYAREDRLDEALGDAKGAVRDDPEDADAYAVRGYIYEKKGDRAMAAADREAAKRFRAKTPNLPDEEIAFAKALHRCLLQLVPTLERPEQQPSASASSSLGTSQMSIVNPRIIIQPEEEERLGVVPP
jgi:beta-lactamase regulating signal transducer with metallopeptidase domain/tetratricopeptide (TPR) repeat protein